MGLLLIYKKVKVYEHSIMISPFWLLTSSYIFSLRYLLQKQNQSVCRPFPDLTFTQVNYPKEKKGLPSTYRKKNFTFKEIHGELILVDSLAPIV